MVTTRNPALHEKTDAPASAPKYGDHFVERMFSGFGHISEVRPAQVPRPPEAPYRPLRQSLRVSAAYALRDHVVAGGLLRYRADLPLNYRNAAK